MMSCTTHLSQELRGRGFRMTPQRHAILHILKDTDGHLSPSEIFGRARQIIPGMTEATVYRTLDFLTENDMVLPSLAGSGHLVYEIAGQDHHHLICRECGAEIQIDHAPLEKVYNELETISGYRLIDSHVTFFGLCSQCQNIS